MRATAQRCLALLPRQCCARRLRRDDRERRRGRSRHRPRRRRRYVAINTDPIRRSGRTIERARESKFPDKQKRSRLDQEGPEQGQGVDWENDVKAALGPEFDFVWLDLENDGQNFVVSTQPKDKAKFERADRKANAAAGRRPTRSFHDTFDGWDGHRAEPGGDRPLRAREQRQRQRRSPTTRRFTAAMRPPRTTRSCAPTSTASS